MRDASPQAMDGAGAGQAAEDVRDLAHLDARAQPAAETPVDLRVHANRTEGLVRPHLVQNGADMFVSLGLEAEP
jgi:hypothetical protein